MDNKKPSIESTNTGLFEYECSEVSYVMPRSILVTQNPGDLCRDCQGHQIDEINFKKYLKFKPEFAHRNAMFEESHDHHSDELHCIDCDEEEDLDLDMTDEDYDALDLEEDEFDDLEMEIDEDWKPTFDPSTHDPAFRKEPEACLCIEDEDYICDLHSLQGLCVPCLKSSIRYFDHQGPGHKFIEDAYQDGDGF